ncbi:hypothetical protein ASG35_06290 [Burkholderia sp. Leaf177]|nr:hypothetical protein ASG35_06290 [Burkholderia sp. Leaf177]
MAAFAWRAASTCPFIDASTRGKAPSAVTPAASELKIPGNDLAIFGDGGLRPGLFLSKPVTASHSVETATYATDKTDSKRLNDTLIDVS